MGAGLATQRKGNEVLTAIADVRDRLDGAGWVIVYNAEPRRDQRALMECLGLEVVVDPERPAGVVHSTDMGEVPAHKATETKLCDVQGCPDEVRYTRGVGAGKCEYHGKPLFQEHGRRSQQGRVYTPRQVKPLPAGSPLNKQAVQLGILGTRVERAAKRWSVAKRKLDEADAVLTAELDQYAEQLRESLARYKALRARGEVDEQAHTL